MTWSVSKSFTQTYSILTKSHIKTDIRYFMYFIIGEVDGYIEGSNGKKHLIFPSTYKNIEILTKYTELWNGIKNFIKEINDKPGEYGKDFIKMKFNSDDNLSLRISQ